MVNWFIKWRNAPSKIILSVELFIVFFLLPVILATDTHKSLKLITVLLGILYVLVVGITRKSLSVKSIQKPSNSYILRVSFLSILLFIIGYIVMKITRPEALFNVPINKTKLWIFILCIYAFVSVTAQELLYRRFFFNRYKKLVKNKKLLFFINVICFSLCHIFLHTTWVLIATALGGALFAYTYTKEKSLFWTCVEHALYGNILFSIGIGAELAFPS